MKKSLGIFKNKKMMMNKIIIGMVLAILVASVITTTIKSQEQQEQSIDAEKEMLKARIAYLELENQKFRDMVLYVLNLYTSKVTTVFYCSSSIGGGSGVEITEQLAEPREEEPFVPPVELPESPQGPQPKLLEPQPADTNNPQGRMTPL